MPSLRKKKTLTKPFVITLAPLATAMLAPGCFSTPTSNPPASDTLCPPSMPVGGELCPNTLQCDYGLDDCGFPLKATCVNNEWQTSGPSACNPPPPDLNCPPELPALGSPCNWNYASGFGCQYTVDIGCGPQFIEATCNGTTVTVEYLAPSCGQCATLTTESGCTTDAACRWLTPGCDMPAVPMAGCFPVQDCAADMPCATAGQTCQQVSYDPCYNKPCDACGAQASVCLPPPAP
jgi:hypothetical protein